MKIWQGTQCVCTLRQHEQTVWALLWLDDGRLLSASADRSIALWKPAARGAGTAPSYEVQRRYLKHTDCVRGLALLSDDVGFLSCGNDGNIFLWVRY